MQLSEQNSFDWLPCVRLELREAEKETQREGCLRDCGWNLRIWGDGVWSWRLEVYTNVMKRQTRECSSVQSTVALLAPEQLQLYQKTVTFSLCISFASHMPCPMYVECGSKTRTQYFDVQKLVQMLGAEQCALPGLQALHAFTGCDTVCAFAGRGKLKGLRLMSKIAQHRETLTLLGSHWDLTDDLYKRLESLTCQLYCAILNVESVNELCYDMFFAKKGEIESWQLPPCSSSLLFFTSKPLQKGKLSMCNLDEELGSIPSNAKSCWHGMVQGPWWTDWGEGLPVPLAVFCLVTAKRNVYRTVVLAYRTVYSAQICASWAPAQIKLQKMKTMQKTSIMMTVMRMRVTLKLMNVFKSIMLISSHFQADCPAEIFIQTVDTLIPF